MDQVIVYGVDTCEDTRRSRRHLDEIRVPYRYINLEDDSAADTQVKEWNGGRRITPTIVISGPTRAIRLAEPANEALDDALSDAGIKRAA